MNAKTIRLCAAAVILGLLVTGAASAQIIWARGNMHTHTTNSDGDSAPQVVADWYRDHGYQFLIITDHGKVTDPATISIPSSGFILVPGQETGVKGAKKPIHGNAFGITKDLPATEVAETPTKSLVKMVQVIRAAGGIPQINHPNFGWSLTYSEIKAVKGPYLMEILNGHPSVHNFGSEAYMPVEQTWDLLLSDGITVYATATDDAHNLKVMDATKANPGRGWIYVRVTALTPDRILAALREGDFYASNGVELADYGYDGKTFKVQVAAREGRSYWIRFVGKWGRILQETTGTSASFVTGKGEANDYVRCKVIADDGSVAWTQAFRIGR